jgi:hypothetical protein
MHACSSRLGWRPPRRIQYPVRFYDVLLALLVMAEVAKVGDPCCSDALDLLAGKQLADGGSPSSSVRP